VVIKPPFPKNFRLTKKSGIKNLIRRFSPRSEITLKMPNKKRGGDDLEQRGKEGRGDNFMVRRIKYGGGYYHVGRDDSGGEEDHGNRVKDGGEGTGKEIPENSYRTGIG